ncbi:MAG: cyclic nucleotide-binding domain-containing protein [Gammaproteobacteria bacterium]|nr:cyclic nucleotide-binding domain-containing protein [Gammaproteobacteria bacterium]
MESSILNLFRHAENIQTFAAGETIFTEGTTGREMYVVLEGSVDIRVGNKTLDVTGPGGIFGEMALIDSSTRSATAIAKDDCTLATVDEQQFLRMLERTPLFTLNVMQILAGRLRRMDSMLQLDC